MANTKDKILGFQYQFSRLFNFNLKTKKFDCISSKDKLWAMNTSKSTVIAIIFTLFGSAHLFSGFIEYYNENGEVQADFYIAFSILFVFGLLCFRQFLWLIKGRQEMTIENGILTLTKKGTFLTTAKSYSLDFVTNIREAFDENSLTQIEKIQLNITLNRKVLFRQIIGQVLFEYKGKTIRVFNDLDKKQRDNLIEEMIKHK